MFVTFDDWTGKRKLASFGTNAGAEELPFQKWKHIKEAYPPELIARAIDESSIPVGKCLDPFGGSGTTALACQFLGVHPTTVEINPFLADLIEAKLVRYDADALARDLAELAGNSWDTDNDVLERLAYLPATFVEPGVDDRWIFNRDIAARIASILTAIDRINEHKHRRLFLVLLGGVLTKLSNVSIRGKGRRYKREWRSRILSPSNVNDAFFEAAHKAIRDIHRFVNRREPGYRLIRGDSRVAINSGAWDLVICSPPYPNSLDYTDVYNLELWVLGYVRNFDANRALRQATLSSHVQISRSFAQPPEGSPLLDSVLAELVAIRSSLWDRRIPEMVGAYFADLMSIVGQIHRRLQIGGSAWLVVGDSRYGGKHISTGRIVVQLAHSAGWRIKGIEPFRPMQSSAQQGGRPQLTETLVVLERKDKLFTN